MGDDVAASEFLRNFIEVIETLAISPMDIPSRFFAFIKILHLNFFKLTRIAFSNLSNGCYKQFRGETE
jgi:hypothetical protein